jgi:dTDP-glucose 4,6-dehydratase
LEVIGEICLLLDELHPDSPVTPHGQLISFVRDRPGHDHRYAMNAGKIMRDLGWQPAESFATGIRKTVIWYLEHQDWVEQVVSGEYRHWLESHYAP